MIGLPMLNGFVGEFLILSSTFTGVSRGWAVAATLGVILGAAYMLWLVQRLFYGTESKLADPEARPTIFASASWPYCAPLVILMLVMGVAPIAVARTSIQNRRASAADVISTPIHCLHRSASRTPGEVQR